MCIRDSASLAQRSTAAPYADLTYDALRSEIIALAREQPRFVRLFTGREAYGDLANVIGGRCSAKHACEHFVLVLTEFASLPPHQAGAGRAPDEGRREDAVEQRRPTNTSSRAEVFLSGALHGDERVGPLATLALIPSSSSSNAKQHASTRNAWPENSRGGVERRATSSVAAVDGRARPA